ncbi:MAG: CRISPR-associated protein Cas4 [Ardenticatenales bacterium]|nr:CRISPR-associated protein Cas4 [Ardenticatenales bacterium]
MMFTATDLKQYLYCARILYYHHCLPAIRPVTHKMEAGIRAHEDESTREARRSLRPYNLKTAERHFDVWVESERLGLRGQVDLVLAEPDGLVGQAWVVEFKLASRLGDHWKLQLAAYAMLLEEQWQIKVERGFVYLIPLRRAEPLDLTTRLKRQVEAALAQMSRIAQEEWMPEPPKVQAKCRDCEFRRFCNDV